MVFSDFLNSIITNIIIYWVFLFIPLQIFYAGTRNRSKIV
ncbi:hypothetical protein BACCOP_01060 [Phocaeicola coprocola DSM 17136]|uniref:Uncharacterized protein n=1 Tax=Phocaeicola coprocola DSM 17136 TaxID=470145 RepID=B3JGQ6_9BACT|nr:hypothetical protein BACCOP_01060 [Phocaeicola coprocola DSM 17136]